MGFRFYRSWKIIPGVRLNLSKSGISTTLGVRGANMNIGRRGRRYTAGLPGTGLSYVRTAARKRRGGADSPGDESSARRSPRVNMWWLVIAESRRDELAFEPLDYRRRFRSPHILPCPGYVPDQPANRPDREAPRSGPYCRRSPHGSRQAGRPAGHQGLQRQVRAARPPAWLPPIPSGADLPSRVRPPPRL